MVFLDTSALVYATAPSSPFCPLAAAALADLEQSDGDLWISRQILREYVAVVTRPQPFAQPMPAREAVRRARAWVARYQLAEDGPEVTRHFFSLVEQVAVGGKQIHDANIVATMLAHGIDRLLTANEVDFVRYQGSIDVVPLSNWAAGGPSAPGQI